MFESASGGTVFLDEIGELPAGAQSALLRVLETGRISRVGSTSEIVVDVRIVAATHRNLERMVEEGLFRARPPASPQRLHALVAAAARARRGILPLAELFLLRCLRDAPHGPSNLSEAARKCLEAYAWPGNVRELRNVIERGFILAEGDSIGELELPEKLRLSSRTLQVPESGISATPSVTTQPLVQNVRARLAEQEREAIRQALLNAGGNRRRAAEELAIPLRTLERRIKQYELTQKVALISPPLPWERGRRSCARWSGTRRRRPYSCPSCSWLPG